MQPGILYLVSTPIGNLQDVTLRALQTLREVAVIACEDTRHTARLLARHGIEARKVSYHAHNERRQLRGLLRRLGDGDSIALVTDAGTPVISDPGVLLVREARAAGIPVVPIPGPSAVLAALAASGLPASPFTFVGFLPPRRGERRRALEDLSRLSHTLIFFEAPHRLRASVADMAAVLGKRQVALCRELTKLHEETVVADLKELELRLREGSAPRGEMTLVVAPPAASRDKSDALDGLPASIQEHYDLALQACDGDRREALRHVARERGISRRQAYQALLEARGSR